MKRVVLLQEALDDLMDAKAFYDRIEVGVGANCVEPIH